MGAFPAIESIKCFNEIPENQKQQLDFFFLLCDKNRRSTRKVKGPAKSVSKVKQENIIPDKHKKQKDAKEKKNGGYCAVVFIFIFFISNLLFSLFSLSLLKILVFLSRQILTSIIITRQIIDVYISLVHTIVVMPMGSGFHWNKKKHTNPVYLDI